MHKLYLCRKILLQSGLDWLSPPHKNNHGTNSLQGQNLTELFSNSSTTTISMIVSKYRKDFELCGYEETLSHLQKMAEEGHF